MNAITRAPLNGEILAPGDCVRLVGKAHPLNGGRVDRLLPAGLTIAEMLADALGEQRRDLIVYLDGHVIEPRNWHRIRVKKGATVTFLPRLSGGNIWRSILAIVVAVAAYTFAGPIAGSLTIAGFALTGTALALATAAVAAGIVLAGTLAINALFPVRPPETEQPGSPGRLNSIQGAQNQANPFGPIPVVLGRHRQSPYYAAKPFTEVVGDDQWLRLLFCMGYGPLAMSDFKIGETPLTSFPDYQIQVLHGFAGDAAPTLYPASVDEVGLSVTLNYLEWNSQTTAAETDEIGVDFTAVAGVIATDEQGNPISFTVTIATRYRLVGASAWTDAPSVAFQRSYQPARRGLRLAVARGQYEVQVQRASTEGNPNLVHSTIVWTALRSTKNAAPVSFPSPLALVALRIKATDQLSGVISTFNCLCTSLVKAYSGVGSVWTNDTASQWPPDLYRHVLQGAANARPVPDAEIDLECLREWWAYCVANGFKFNEVINSVGSVYDKLADIAAAGRAVPAFINGKWGVIWDRPSDSIVQHFTPRNSWGFQGQKPYAQQPHGWRVKFINEENGFTADERIVYDDGYNASNATLFEGMQFPGVTDPDLIWKHGRFHIAQARLRPEKISLNVGWEHLICTRGDRVRVTHDVLLIGLASGRIKSVAGQVVTLDETVTIEAGKTYAMQFRVAATARTIDRAVDAETPAGEYRQLTLVGDLSGLAAGDLFGFGETEQASADYRVQAIAHQKDLVATLTLVDDAPEISLADQGEIPDYDPHVSIPADPFTQGPRDLRYVEVIEGRGAGVSALVRLFWQVPRFGRIAAFEVQRRDDDAGGDWVSVDPVLPPTTTADVPFSTAGIWSFRVRSVFTDGTNSDWASLIGLNLAGLSAVPDNVTNLHQRSVDGQTVLDWTIVEDRRPIAYEVRKGTSWDTGLVVGDGVQPPWATTGDGDYHVRSFVRSPFGDRIYCAATASITIAGSIISRNIIVSQDEQALGWPGRLDGGVIDGSFIRTDIAEVISQPFAQEVIDQLALEGLHIAVYVSDVTVDIGRAAECRFWTLYEASGVLRGEDFLGQTDVLAAGDVLGTAPTRFIQAFPIWRFAADGSSDVFAPVDVFDPADVFQAGVTFGEWVGIASGTRVARHFQPGFVLITDDATTDATGTKFSWFVDVPDRTDDYTELEVPDTGLAITFYAGGYDGVPVPGANAVPFNGGPNGASVPHVQRAIVNGSNGDEVKITDLTLAGCTVHVVNSGANVTRAGVNLLVRGY